MNKRAEGMPEAQAAGPVKPEKPGTNRKEKSKRSVIIYIATLFIVVFLFILLSYFVQQRNNSQISTLSERNATAQQNIENLQQENLQLKSDNTAFQERIANLEAQVADLQNQLGGQAQNGATSGS
ncbi:hypothetical protein IZU99_10705 [Oscillospiraceae bacterium CM]|nr:hypothetical protein IZU99_10705 [Oscillospiraceae bacterium CM]